MIEKKTLTFRVYDPSSVEKKPLRGEMYDDIMMISYLGPNVVVNFKFKEWKWLFDGSVTS